MQAVIIPDGAHHLDLMFSNPLDPLTVKAARTIELDNIERWIEEYHAQGSQYHTQSSPSVDAAGWTCTTCRFCDSPDGQSSNQTCNPGV